MNLGGQAVIEGVMIRSPNHVAVSIRKNKTIKTKITKKNFLTKRYDRLVFIRGIISLIEMLFIGMQSLIYSAKEAEDKEVKISNTEIVITIIISLIVAIGLFVIAPFYLSKIITENRFLFNLLEGIFRIVIFLLYLIVISASKDIRRIFQYHGAEHKAVHCYEHNKELTIKNVQKYQTMHPRCGTSFIIIVLVFTILVFSLVWHTSWLINLLYRIILVPIIAAISYELLKLSATIEDSLIGKILIWPGIQLQKLTTKEPTDDQVEVAIAAVKAIEKNEKSYGSSNKGQMLSHQMPT